MSSVSYFNGNYFVTSTSINSGGRIKRCLRRGEVFNPSFPDSIDIKITNKCEWGCPYCFESSNPKGKEMNLDKTKEVLSMLPPVGIELAIGGGNIMTNKKLTSEFIKWANDYGFSTRATISYRDLENLDNEGNDLLKSLGYIGVSVDFYNEKILDFGSFNIFCPTIVYQVIVGVIPIDDFWKYLEYSRVRLKTINILILGFKKFGRAKDMEIPNLEEWRSTIKKVIYNIRCRYYREVNLCFDNLAMEQLEIRELILDEEWDKLFFGREFSSSMYIDAVEETFAPTSRDPKRTKWDETDILTYFRENKHEY